MVSEEKMFENVDGRTDRRTDGRRTDDGVTGILLAHPWAFGSGELKINKMRFRINERHRPFGFGFKLILYCYLSVNSYDHVGTVNSPNHTFFPGQAWLSKLYLSTSCTYFRLLLTTTLLESAEGRRMTEEIISWSISMKVWGLGRDWTCDPAQVLQ